jgi:MFS family permease
MAMFIIMAFIGGAGFSFGVFFKSLESAFHLSRATTSAIFSLSMVLSGLCGVLGGWLLDRYGPRIVLLVMGIFTGLSLLLTSQTNAAWQLFITYSVILAMGMGPIYVVSMSTVLRWFRRKRGLAVGIASSGGGLGQITIAPLAAFLITTYDWRIAYIVVGLMVWLVALPLSRLLRRDPQEMGILPDGDTADSLVTSTTELKEKEYQKEGLSLVHALRTRSFWLFFFMWLSFSFCMLMVLTHVVPHATDMGIPSVQAAAIISLFGGATIAGRVTMGTIADRIGRKKVAICCSLLEVVAMVWLVWARDLWALYLFAFVFGFGNGGAISVVTALIGDYLGLERIGVILGVLEIGWGPGSAIGPIVGGLIFDINGSYVMAFFCGAFTMLVGALLIGLSKRETK